MVLNVVLNVVLDSISLFQEFFRSSHLGCSIRKVILKNFSKLTGKKPVPMSLF